VSRQDQQREERLAAALRENLRRRKAQARQILPGTGRGTAEGGGGAEDRATDPSVSADALPPPRSGEDWHKDQP
jgi:hypothetical protein